ncbi:ACT domain-containing protein [Cladochytrium replicatum]|nr:ACT domain-containing protein [Cladochytrium replicatum]
MSTIDTLRKLTAAKFTLVVYPDQLAIFRWPPAAVPNALFPLIINNVTFFSLTRTQDEFSLVLPADVELPTDPLGVPPKSEAGWRAFRVQGQVDFSEVGVMAAITIPLAEAGLSIFVVSTFDTDYVLVKEDQLSDAIKALEAAKFTVKKTMQKLGKNSQ